MGRYLEPLHGLADAFRQNTEALRALAEGQAAIGKRLERSDRSEAVIHSTQALNDTFRGVQRTQERLMSRMDRERKHPWLLLTGGIVGIALVVGGLLWFLLGWVAEREEAAGGQGIEVLEGELGRRDSAIADLREDLERRGRRIEELQGTLGAKAGELARQESLTQEQKRLAEELRAAVAELEDEREGFRETQASVSRLLGENAGLSTENAELRQEVEQLRRDLAAARSADAEKDAQITTLTRRIEELVRRSAGGTLREPSPTAPEPVAGRPADAGEDPAGQVPPGAMTDPAQLTRLTSLLNDLIGAAAGGESCDFLRIGGVRGRVLYGVELVTRDASGREATRVEARECRVVYWVGERRAEIRFWNGYLTYYGVRTKFLGNRHVVRIGDIDPTQWSRSGLTIVERVR
jgi:hypothetical protein